MRILCSAAIAALLSSPAAGAPHFGNAGSSTVQATAVSVGGRHSCARTSEGVGGVKCWGSNQYGQLGNGSTSDSSVPVDVTGLTSGVRAIAAGAFHTCALTSAGGVKCWGRNAAGQLGNGTTTDSSTPVDVAGLTSGVAAISAGDEHTCAVTAGGAVRCWGQNGSGQLGDNGSCGQICPTPVAVFGLASGALAVAAGGAHSCALTSAGAVDCWGYNLRGQVGDGTTTERYAPVPVSGLGSGVAAIAAGGNHSCAVTSGGGAKCWGWNLFGQLGDGQSCACLVPVDVTGLTGAVAAVDAGALHTCADVLPFSVRCWGDNRFGAVGDGGSCGSPCSTPVQVSGPADYVAVSAGGDDTCALTGPGGIRCWGANQFGQLGDGSTNASATPVEVIGFGPPSVVCRVPNVIGKTFSKAKVRILGAHCRVGKVTRKRSSAKRKGRVLSERPKPGTRLAKGARVALTVGKGPRRK